LLHDAARCLAIADQGQLHFDDAGRPRQATLATLARATWLGSAPPDVARARLLFLVDLLRQAGLAGLIGRTLHTTATALEWLAQPPEQQVLALRQVWWLAPELAWRWLPAERRRRSLAPQWRAITLEALRRLANLPPERWTTVHSVGVELVATAVLPLKGVEQNLPRVRQASQRQAVELLSFLIADLLPALALAEAENRNGVLHLRLTEEGRAWLSAALARRIAWDGSAGPVYELSAPDAALAWPQTPAPFLHVDETLAVSLALHAPAGLAFDLMQCADLLSPGPPAHYRISAHSLQRAAARGYSATDMHFWLQRYGGAALPQAASEQLAQWQDQAQHVLVEAGYKLTFASPQALAALRQLPTLRPLLLPLASGQEAWLALARAPQAWRHLRRLDFQLTPTSLAAPPSSVPLGLPDAHDDRMAKTPPMAWPPAGRPALPLPALLALVRTYRWLRQRTPGLAPLDLDALEQALLAALPAHDLAGVEQLVAANQAQLARSWPSADADPDPPADEGARRQRLLAAIAAGEAVSLRYADASAQVSQRTVQPLRLETRWGQEYLVAFCQLRQDERSFRLDRIVTVGDR
jgi:hypothetical protein